MSKSPVTTTYKDGAQAHFCNISDVKEKLSLTFATPIDEYKQLLDEDGDDLISDLNRFSIPYDLLKSKKLSGLLKLSCNEDLLVDDVFLKDLLPSSCFIPDAPFRGWKKRQETKGLEKHDFDRNQAEV